MAKLAVIVVSWNTEELTRNCLKSVEAELNNIDSEIWVVDNASSDLSVEMINNEFPRIKIIENRENFGFARANNQALKAAEADYYLLLNSDTIIPQNSIKNMLSFLDSNPQAAACAPRLIKKNGEAINPIQSLPSIFGEIRNCFNYHFFPVGNIMRRLLSSNTKLNKNDQRPIQKEILSAACLIIRRETIKKIGYLGEEFFLFSEENDYFTRLKNAKLDSYYLPNIDVIHLIGMSRMNLNQYESDYNFFKSRILYFKKYCSYKSGILKLVYCFFFYWSIMTLTLWRIIKKKKNECGENLYKSLLKTLYLLTLITEAFSPAMEAF